MKKSDLKKFLGPIIDECVKERIHGLLLESGVVSNIVSEVMKGMMPTLIQEGQTPRPGKVKTLVPPPKKKIERTSQQREELREIANEAYAGISGMNIGGVNIFEGVAPIMAQADPMSPPGPLGGDPGDPGIDISKLGIIKQLK